MISYKNLIRAIENAGIATSYVVQYYSTGTLNIDDMIQFLQATTISNEYLNQASNFSPLLAQKLKIIKNSSYYEVVSKRYFLSQLIAKRFLAKRYLQVILVYLTRNNFFRFEDVEFERRLNFGADFINSLNQTEVDDFGKVKEIAKEKQAKALTKIYQAITIYMKKLRELQNIQREYIR